MTNPIKNNSLTRHTVILSSKHKTKLEQIAKGNKLSQGDLVEVMIDLFDPDSVVSASAIIDKRNSKTDGRKTRFNADRQLLEKVKKVDPNALAVFLATQNS